MILLDIKIDIDATYILNILGFYMTNYIVDIKIDIDATYILIILGSDMTNDI